MSHTIKHKKQLLLRVRRIKGQIEALENVFKTDTECSSVLQQIAAIRGAINGLMNVVLEGHILEHLGAENISTEQRKVDAEQLIQILRSYLK